jgi:hypothetical protein
MSYLGPSVMLTLPLFGTVLLLRSFLELRRTGMVTYFSVGSPPPSCSSEVRQHSTVAVQVNSSTVATLLASATIGDMLEVSTSVQLAVCTTVCVWEGGGSWL